MNERTRNYLRGRFGDHYRRSELPVPPALADREWGYIPWTAGPETTMVRHQALATPRDLEIMLDNERPRHVYHSAATYAEPGAGVMGAKGWRGADLVFDLDADHLPGIDPETEPYARMLEACKEELQSLLDFLCADFGFEEPMIVFSGGRGYHVHVRREDVRKLERDARRDVVDYIKGHGVDLDTVLSREYVAGSGRTTPADKRTLDTTGGWSRRVHQTLMAFIEELNEGGPDAAEQRLLEIEGIGSQRAARLSELATTHYDELAAGNIDVHPAMMTLLDVVIDQAVEHHQAAIDEPVTTDVHRLIRLPGSLHGGTGLVVTPVRIDELAGFDPLVDAIPSSFTDQRITVEITESGPVEVGETPRMVEAGVTTVPEYVGIFLMCRGRAEKTREPAASRG